MDIEPQTYNIDPKSLKKAITKKTRAIIPVHIYGQAANMDEILKIAKAHNLKVIEDAAQAHGARYKGKRIGSLGDVACFSFYPTKGLGAFGDGGMIVTSDDKIYEKCLMLRDYGRQGRYEHKIKGYNSRLDTVQAVVLSAKLKHLDRWNGMRAKKAEEYRTALQGVKGVATPAAKPDRFHLTKRMPCGSKTAMVCRGSGKGVSVLIHYPIRCTCRGLRTGVSGRFSGVGAWRRDPFLPMFHISKKKILCLQEFKGIDRVNLAALW